MTIFDLYAICIKKGVNAEIKQKDFISWKYTFIQFQWKSYKVVMDVVNGLHLVVFGKKSLPSYQDLKLARYLFCPDEIYMAEVFPPKSEFVNIHEFARQLFQVNQAYNKEIK